MNKNILKIRIVSWLVLTVIAGVFIYLKIVPTGRISYRAGAGAGSYFIGKLTPAERVEFNNKEATVKADPVYFSLKTPRRFEKAKVTVKFKNSTGFPIMEMGPLNNKVTGSYDLKPMENKIIDRLAMAWPAVFSKNGVRLIERAKKYDTVEQFLNNPPDKNEIALYDYDFKSKFLLNDYAPKKAEQSINYNFRGAYQFYTYVKNEELNYIFNFVDLNADKEGDPVDIKVYSQDGLVYEKRVEDNSAEKRQASLKISNLPEGVYRVSFAASSDVITEKITTSQSRFALINKIWLAAGNKKIPAIYTNGREIGFMTTNPAGLQKIRIGGATVDLNETYKRFFSPVARENRIIELTKDDVVISGDGVFGFTESGLLDSRLKNVGGNLDINAENINYVLTDYQTPESSGGWQIASAEFDLTKAYQENGKYQFLISVPGLKTGESAAGEIIVKEISVSLEGTGLRQKLKKMFKK